MAEVLLFDGVEIKSLFRVLRAELIASQDGLTTSEIKSCYKTYFGKVNIYTFIYFIFRNMTIGLFQSLEFLKKQVLTVASI